MKLQNDRFRLSPYLRVIRETGNFALIKDFMTNHVTRISLADWEKIVQIKEKPIYWDMLCDNFGETRAKQLIDQKTYLLECDVWRIHGVNTIEIETCTICNWKCKYCPPKGNRKIEYMGEALFTDILKKAVAYGKIKTVTLHGFNEPTMDYRLLKFISEIMACNLSVSLYTNGSGFNAKLINILRQYKNRICVTFNCPSAEEEIFNRITGSKDFSKTMAAIEQTIKVGVKTCINIQGNRDESTAEAIRIKKMFPSAQVLSNGSLDRAGLLKNQYFENYHNTNPLLSGCEIASKSLFVNVKGQVYLCCNDYFNQYILGDLKTDVIADILVSDTAIRLRQKIWGGQIPESEFICRKCSYSQHLDQTCRKL